MANFASLCMLFLFLTFPAWAGFKVIGKSDVLPLASDQNLHGLSVLWWNTACAASERSTERNSQFHNLKEMAAPENQVDLIFLGEFCPDKTPAEVLRQLYVAYPYSSFVPYTLKEKATAYIGFGILSRSPIVVQPAEHLDWLPENRSQQDREQLEAFWRAHSSGIPLFPRSYNRLQVVKNGVAYEIVPTHLAHPWQTYISRWYKDDPIGRRAAIAHEILFGKENPLVWQLDNLLSKVKRDISKSEKLLMIGDFNIPVRLPDGFGPRSYAYERISEAALADGMRLTQPTHRDTNLRIDHAFVSSSLKVSKRRILPLQGSDHFPIYVQVH